MVPFIYYSVWLGATDSEVRSVFRWSDGCILNWTRWGDGMPDNTGHCVVRRPDATWSDRPCDREKKFYCESGL